MFMGDQIDDCDPQQYKEEWFDVAITPIGREFELPNLSNTCCQPAISSDPSLAIATNQICVHSVSSLQSYSCPSALLVTRRQLQSHNEVPFYDDFRSSIVTAGQLRHQNPHFKSNISTSSSSNFSNHENVPNVNGTNYQISTGTARAPILTTIGHGLSSKTNQFVVNDDPIKPKQEVPDESQAHLHGKNKHPCCSLNHKTMSKTTEAQCDLEGEHRCFVCNVTFATGNALGGHMSSHAKKRKMEVMKNGGDLSIFKSQNGSNQPPNETYPAITSCDCHSIMETTTENKIEGNKACIKQHGGSSANTHIDADDHEAHGLSTKVKVARQSSI